MNKLLPSNYMSKSKHISIIDKELSVLELKLRTDGRTAEDLVRHMELLKERNALLKND